LTKRSIPAGEAAPPILVKIFLGGGRRRTQRATTRIARVRSLISLDASEIRPKWSTTDCGDQGVILGRELQRLP